jgi:hypothetical protein
MGGVMPFIHVYILKLFEDNKTTLAFDYNLLTCVHAPIPKHYDLQTSTPGQDAHWSVHYICLGFNLPTNLAHGNFKMIHQNALTECFMQKIVLIFYKS